MSYRGLTDEQWNRLQAILPSRRRGPRSRQSDRIFVDAVLYRAQMGIGWRDLPAYFGPWQSIYNRLWKWKRRGLWPKVLQALQLSVDRYGFVVDGDSPIAAAPDGRMMSLDRQLRELAAAAQALATTLRLSLHEHLRAQRAADAPSAEDPAR